jgi:hypothetical protein
MPSSDLSSAIDPAADEQAQATLLQTFLATAHHFCPCPRPLAGVGRCVGSFVQLFADVRDPRCPELIRYPLAALLFAGVLLFVCRLGARRQINHLLRGNGASAAKFEALFQVASCPHGDTLKAAYRRLAPDELQAVVTGMTETLIRRKVLYPFRLLDRYFLVAMDGTGVLVFTERHCPHCLTMTHHDQTLYYHPILEAKLVTATGFVFSLMTEFIENPGEQPTKQDCELKAFYRLAQRLKQRFPRLPICLLLDGLFAGGPTFTRCEDYGWKYLITLQDGDLPSVHQDFEALMKLAPDQQLHFTPPGYPPVPQDFRWMNDLS